MVTMSWFSWRSSTPVNLGAGIQEQQTKYFEVLPEFKRIYSRKGQPELKMFSSIPAQSNGMWISGSSSAVGHSTTREECTKTWFSHGGKTTLETKWQSRCVTVSFECYGIFRQIIMRNQTWPVRCRLTHASRRTIPSEGHGVHLM